MNKLIVTFTIIVIMAFCAFGQNEQKIVVIKSGKGDLNIDSLLKDHKIIDKSIIYSSDTITKNVTVTSDDEGHRMIKIVKKNANGKEEVIEWEGNGEIPTELDSEIKNINTSINKSDDGITTITIDAETDGDEGYQIEKKSRKSKENSERNKIQLGVVIDDSGEEGVVVSDFIANSPASMAGIKRGDTILKIGNSYIFNIKGLRKAMLPFEKGETCPVVVLRSGKEKKIKVRL